MHPAIHSCYFPLSFQPTHIHALSSCPPALLRHHSGTNKDSRGTAYVVYEDIYDAKNAADHLSGFNVQNRYLIVLYYNPTRQSKKLSLKEQEEQVRDLMGYVGVYVSSVFVWDGDNWTG